MGFFAEIKKKVATKVNGELITNMGTLPFDKHGGEISLAIRRYPGKQVHLQVKMVTSETHHFQILCTHEWANQFERVAKEMRKYLDVPQQ